MLIQPCQWPFWVIRVMSMNPRVPTRRVKRGSSIGKARPVKVSSAAMPSCSATVKRSTFSGSTTSIFIGPTEMSIRSLANMREARRQCCTPSTRIEKWQSITLRCGYTPSPTIQNTAPSGSNPLKK